MYDFFDFLKTSSESLKYSSFESEILYTGRDISGAYPDDLHKKNEEKLISHFKKNPERFKKYNWVDDDGNLIYPKYKTNKFGYRTQIEYEDGISIALGCSYTFGLGVHEEQTWPYLLSKELNKPIINLGICGGSLDSSYRVLKSYLEEYKPDCVFISIPSALRFSLMYRRDSSKIGTLLILPNHTHSTPGNEGGMIKDYVDKLYEGIYGIDENMYLNFNKNLDAIRYLCSSNNIKLVELLCPAMYNQNNILEKNNITYDYNISFDDIHLGPEINEVTTSEFLKLYNID